MNLSSKNIASPLALKKLFALFCERGRSHVWYDFYHVFLWNVFFPQHNNRHLKTWCSGYIVKTFVLLHKSVTVLGWKWQINKNMKLTGAGGPLQQVQYINDDQLSYVFYIKIWDLAYTVYMHFQSTPRNTTKSTGHTELSKTSRHHCPCTDKSETTKVVFFISFWAISKLRRNPQWC